MRLDGILARLRSSAAAAPLTDAVEWRLIQGLFDQRSILVAGGVSTTLAAGVTFWRVGNVWFLAWGLSALGVLAGRLIVDERFKRRAKIGEAKSWAGVFLVGVWMSGALCGLGTALAIFVPDAFTQMLFVAMLTAFITGSATRNAAFPPAAIGSVLLAEGPLFVACLAKGRTEYYIFCVFIVHVTAVAIAMSRHLHERNARFYRSEEENANLVSQIRAANLGLEAANRQLALIATMDGLTGVANRITFDGALEKELKAARRDGSFLSLLMVDVDLFKNFNDRYGHQAGDECLRRVAQTLEACLRRPTDFLARYGGEEFVAVLPHTDRRQATTLGEKIRATIEDLAIENAASDFERITVSIGVATSSNDGRQRADLLVKAADEALYEAKRAGRNCVRLGGDKTERFAQLAAKIVSPDLR